MNKAEVESLVYCIKHILEGAYFGYTMIYTIDVPPTNSMRIVLLVDCKKSPLEIDLYRKGINITL